MANNEYVNKVLFGDTTIMDISDTTAEEGDVIEGQTFYTRSGAPATGTLGDATTTTHGLMSTTDKIKLDGINLLGVKLNTTALTPDSNGYISIPLMTGATSSVDGTAGLIPAPTTADAEKFFRGDGTWQDGGRPMVILSYGNSTWDDFITAYNNHVIVYCRASSNSNPKTGSQTRMAFMAYVNNADTPTEVEFQYYRSMSSHSATQMGDQVYVYKLTNKNAWTVTVREASVKQVNVSGSGLSASWSSNQVTLSNTMTAADMPMSSSDATTVSSTISGQSQSITNLSGKIDVESVTSLPFRTGIFYCSTAQTIGSVTIPNHFIYDIHVSGTTATGIAVRATTGAAYSLYGYEGAWVSAIELATKSDIENSSRTIQPLTSRFTARSAFCARRWGKVISFASYVNITSNVPAGEEFADIGYSDAYGVVVFSNLDGSTNWSSYCNNGKFSPEKTIPSGWYVIIGTIVCS